MSGVKGCAQSWGTCLADVDGRRSMRRYHPTFIKITNCFAGYALGYIFGGLVGAALGWRAAFLLEAAAMLPFVVFCLRAPPISLRGSSSSGSRGGSGQGQGTHLQGSSGGGGVGDIDARSARPPLVARMRAGCGMAASDLALLLRHPVYVWTVAGMTVYTAVLGAFAFYGPKAGRDAFGIAPERADLAFGAITVLTGVGGGVWGGLRL